MSSSILLSLRKNIKPFTFGVLLSVLVIEISIWSYFKFWAYIEPSQCRKPHPMLFSILIPNSICRHRSSEWDVLFKVNSLGLKDKDYSKIKPADTIRILVLGDSFTEGYGVDQQYTYSSVSEKLLNKTNSGKFEVLNAGITGYSPTLEYWALKTSLLSLQPDIVILALDLTDFHDEYIIKKQLSNKKQHITDSDISLYADIEINYQSQIDNSSLLNFINNILKKHQQVASLIRIKIESLKEKPQNQLEYIGKFGQDQFLIARNPSVVEYNRLLDAPKETLVTIRDLLNKNNTPFFVMLYPHAFQAKSSEWATGRQLHGFENNRIYPFTPQEDIENFLLEENIKALNMLSTFQNSAEFPLYYPYDGHFTEKGHSLLAETLTDFLLSNIFQSIKITNEQ